MLLTASQIARTRTGPYARGNTFHSYVFRTKQDFSLYIRHHTVLCLVPCTGRGSLPPIDGILPTRRQNSHVHPGRYPIFDSSEDTTGQVRLFIRYATPLLAKNGAPREWELEATVIACKDLPSQDLGGLGNNEVYVKLEAMGSQWPRQTSTVNSAVAGRTRSESKVGAITRTLTRANKHCCSWGEDGEGEVKVIELCDVPPTLGVSVFDEDKGGEDDLIGKCVVEVGAQISAHAKADVLADAEEETDAEASPDWSTEGWFDLTESKRGKKAGTIQLKE